MGTTNLEKLIAESIAVVEKEEADAKAKAAALEAEYRELLRDATEKALATIERNPVPAALLPYCEAAEEPNRWDREADIEQIRKGWRPRSFRINAPGLTQIDIYVDTDWDVEAKKATALYIKNFTVQGSYGYYDNTWPSVIAKAARTFTDNEQWREEQARTSAETQPAWSPAPTIADQLMETLREFIRKEIQNHAESGE